MKKKGFTLIELLAVIVILAIIALIATPIILGMIENAKKSSAEDSAYGYLDSLEKRIALSDVDSNKYPNVFEKNKTYNIGESELDSINIKGTKPTSGTVTIGSNGTVESASLCINNYKIVYMYHRAVISGGCDAVYKAYKTGTTSEVDVIYFNPESGTKCTSSEALSTTGTKTGCMKWYVIANSDKTKSTVDVILDHNTTSGVVAWNSSGINENGPQTLLSKLYEDTSSWAGVTNRNDVYRLSNAAIEYTIDYYGKKARLITANELRSIIGNTEFNEKTTNVSFDFSNVSCSAGNCDYSWIYSNNINNYWTATATYENSGSKFYAWGIFNSGSMFGLSNVGSTRIASVRPVITIEKSKLS